MYYITFDEPTIMLDQYIMEYKEFNNFYTLVYKQVLYVIIDHLNKKN